MKNSQWRLWLCSVWVALIVGCGGVTAPIRPSEAPSQPVKGSDTAAMQLGSAEMERAAPSQSAAPSKAGNAIPSVASDQSEATAKSERPGLATQFGEDRHSKVRHASFTRATPATPFVTTTIWYNDTTGAEAMARNAREHAYGRAEIELFHGGLVVNVLDENGRVLNGLVADQKRCAIGEAGSRYIIGIQNRTDFNFEIVTSVDGLSVIDGRPAAFDRAGYVLYAHQTIAIEGFRTSTQSVAAFRFGKVNESYSVEMGHGDRNVGVIGVAFFHEEGKTPVYPDDTRLRDQANPFPGEYAPRPKER